MDFRSGQPQILKGKCRIRQSIAEGIQRVPVHFDVFSPACRFPGIVARDLTCTARIAHCQMSGWIHIPEQNLCRCQSALFPVKACLQNRRDMRLLPGTGNRTSRIQDQHHRGTRFIHCFQKIQLLSGQVKGRPVKIFPGGFCRIPKCHNRQIAFFCQPDRAVDGFFSVVVAENHPHASRIISKFHTHIIFSAALKGKRHHLACFLIFSPTINNKFSVNIQPHTVRTGQSDPSFKALRTVHRCRPADAELSGIYFIIRGMVDPVEVDLRIESRQNRFSRKICTVEIFRCKAVINLRDADCRTRLCIEPPALQRLDLCTQNIAALVVDNFRM